MLSGAGWRVWWKIDSRVEKVEKATGERIAAAEEKADKAVTDLAKLQLHVAETYVTKAGMQEHHSQIMRAIETIGSRLDSRLDGVNERLDRFVENQLSRRTTMRG